MGRHYFTITVFLSLFVLFACNFLAPETALAKGAAPQESASVKAPDGKNSPGMGKTAKPGEKDNPPKGLTATPKLATPGGRGIFTLTFNKPMIDEKAGMTGKPLAPEDMPFSVAPPLEGEGMWTDKHTFVFASYKALPKATTFTVTPREKFASLDGTPYEGKRFSWTPYPFAFSSNQTRYAADGTVTLETAFSSPVEYAKLKSALRVTDEKGTSLAFALKPLKDEARGQRVNVLVKPEKLGHVILALPEGFLSEAGPVGIAKEHASRKVATTSMLSVRTVRARQTSSPPWERYIEVNTTNSADVDKVRQYLDISPPMDVDIIARSGGFCIAGDFITKPRVRVTFKKGMQGLNGLLLEDYTATVVFNDFMPRMAFETRGTVLSPNRSMRVPISTINVEKVQATLWQLPESNIPFMAMGFFDRYKKHLSRKIAVRSGPVNALRNTAAESSIDLAQIAGKAKGVFLLTLSDAGDPQKARADEPPHMDRDGYFDEYYDDDGIAAPVEKLVVISDIGITARVMPDSITVWANAISTADAVRNARVRVFTANNVLLAEGRTDKDGLWRHVRDEDWSGRERPAIVLVSTAASENAPKAEPGLAEASVTDMAYLKLENDLAVNAEFDTGGRPYLRSGYEAYCFTPRGVFRPGETVDFKVMVRDAAMQAPQEFPVAWTVRSSTGRTVGRGTALLGKEGGASFAFPLVPSAPTGRYTMVVSVPGKGGKSLGFCAFSVEDFQPPRMEITLTPEKPYTVGTETITVALDAKYLFGAPGANAPYESDANITARAFSHPDWRSFFFPSRQEKPLANARIQTNGTLDASGKGAVSVTPEKDWTAPAYTVGMTVRAREDGGRWVARNVTVPHYTAPFLLGFDPGREQIQAGSPHSLRVAAVTPDGKPAEIAGLAASVSRLETYYVRSDRGYTQSTRLVPVTEVPVGLENGVGTVTFTPPAQATYQISLEDAAKRVSARYSLHVTSGITGTDDGASPLVDRVMLSWERPRYQVGETAVLRVRSPFPGKLLIALEGEKEIFRMVLPMTGTETTVNLPVLPGMLPNAYCSAWVIRPVLEGETWGAHRAYGVIPMLLDRSAAKLNVALSAPEKSLPKTTMPVRVTVTVTDAHGEPVRGEVSLALVDEGILSLTNHKTPDPFAFFTAKRALQGTAFDVYDDLMPLSARKPITLQAGGGAAGDASLLSPTTRKLEVLSIFLGNVKTDGNGVAETTLTLPEYSGKGRLMAVAASQKAVGSGAKAVGIAREVTVEATVPRMVAPGDSFAVPVIAFGDGSKALKAAIQIRTEGPLSIAPEQQAFALSLDANTPKTTLPLTIKALDESGPAAINVITTIEGSDAPPFEQRLEIPVRPPFPRLTKTGGGIVKGGETGRIDIGGGFYPGTQRVSLTFSNTPGIGLQKALDYLMYYPYGCLEQTTSSAWPYLAVPAMLKSIDPEKAKDTEFRQGLDFAVRRILAMQRGDGAFNGWPGSSSGPSSGNPSPWASVYAAHFLSEAKSTSLVPEDALRAVLTWMRSYLSSSLPEKDDAVMDALSVKAYICYVLALNGDAPLGWMQFLKDQGPFLSQSARIFLAGAFARATGKTDALKELGTLPYARVSRYGWSLESPARNEALRLLMWTGADPFAPETALLAQRVLDDGGRDRWRSTQENAMAVMAVGRFIEKTAGNSRDFTAVLEAVRPSEGTVKIAGFTSKDTPVFTRNDLSPAPPQAPYPINARIEGEGAAYYSWTTSGVPMQAPAPFAEGLSVFRRWVLPDGAVHDFIPGPDGALPEEMRALEIPYGTRVTVTLFIKPEAAMNSLVLADIVPGGFEIDNPSLVPDSEYASNAGTVLDPRTGKPFARPKGFERAISLNTFIEGRSEMRDDRLLLFADHLPARPAFFTYTLRAVNKGEFVLPPVSAEDMYDPSIRALTPTAKVIVDEEQPAK